MKNRRHWLASFALSIAVAFIAAGPSLTAHAAIMNGSSSANAGVSAKQILLDGFSVGSGLYWIDPDGPGGGAAFQAFADMDANGGGWTLGIVSSADDPVSIFDISTNTGTAGLTLTHTRDLSNLALDRNAEIMYSVFDNSSAQIFLGVYTGRFDDALPSFTTFIDTLPLNGSLDKNFDFVGSDYDVSVFVRELVTPEFPSAVPLPAALPMFFAALGGFGLMGWRRKRGAGKVVALRG